MSLMEEAKYWYDKAKELSEKGKTADTSLGGDPDDRRQWLRYMELIRSFILVAKSTEQES